MHKGIAFCKKKKVTNVQNCRLDYIVLEKKKKTRGRYHIARQSTITEKKGTA